QAVLRQEKVGLRANDVFELLLRAPRIAHQVQRGPEPMPQRRVIRRELEPFAKQRGGARPVLVVERLDPARLVTLRTLEKVAKLHNQGIGRKDWPILAESKVRGGLA